VRPWAPPTDVTATNPRAPIDGKPAGMRAFVHLGTSFHTSCGRNCNRSCNEVRRNECNRAEVKSPKCTCVQVSACTAKRMGLFAGLHLREALEGGYREPRDTAPGLRSGLSCQIHPSPL
jgi:hypothetical protein